MSNTAPSSTSSANYTPGTAPNANAATIMALYEAFGKGDVATILSRLSDNVSWDNTRVASKECPWNGNFSGKANVSKFFSAVGDNLDFSIFNPHTYVASGNNVVVLLNIESTLKKNGHKNANEAVHVWTFDNDGKVSAYQHYNDTAMELENWRA